MHHGEADATAHLRGSTAPAVLDTAFYMGRMLEKFDSNPAAVTSKGMLRGIRHELVKNHAEPPAPVRIDFKRLLDEFKLDTFFLELCAGQCSTELSHVRAPVNARYNVGDVKESLYACEGLEYPLNVRQDLERAPRPSPRGRYECCHSGQFIRNSVRELTQDEPLRMTGAVMGFQNVHLSYYMRGRPQFCRITRARAAAPLRANSDPPRTIPASAA